MKTFSLLVIGVAMSIAGSLPLLAQTSTVWTEDFSGYANGTTTGTGSRWTSACPSCLSGDFFEVRNGVMEAVDVNDWVSWTTQSIDISGCSASTVSIRVDVEEIGDHEGPGCACGINIDYFDLYYSLDGGPFTVLPNWMNDGEPTHTLTGDTDNGVFTDADFGTHSIVVSGLTGNSVVLRIDIRNTSGSESMRFDNVIVECILLPVEWGQIDAQREEDDVLVTWSTLEEINNHYFSVERSLDGVDFAPVGRVDAGGSRNSAYSFLDTGAPSGAAWYRLRQIDYDGQASYSDVVEVRGLDQALNISGIAPNPAGNNARLLVSSYAEGWNKLQISDLSGRILVEDRVFLNQGDNSLPLELGQLSQGMYWLQLSGASGRAGFRLLKK